MDDLSQPGLNPQLASSFNILPALGQQNICYPGRPFFDLLIHPVLQPGHSVLEREPVHSVHNHGDSRHFCRHPAHHAGLGSMSVDDIRPHTPEIAAQLEYCPGVWQGINFPGNKYLLNGESKAAQQLPLRRRTENKPHFQALLPEIAALSQQSPVSSYPNGGYMNNPGLSPFL